MMHRRARTSRLVRMLLVVVLLALEDVCAAEASDKKEEALARSLAEQPRARVQLANPSWSTVWYASVADGQLIFASSDSAGLSSPLSLANVARIQVRKDCSLEGALLGGLLGAALGAVVGAGYAQMDDSIYRESVTVAGLKGGFLGALGGAGVGLLIGNMFHQWSTVYRHDIQDVH